MIDRIDHLVLTVKSIEATVDFYCDILGMKALRFGEGRIALAFGRQKINLHEVSAEFEPKARQATSGSADLCFLSETPLADWIAQLAEYQVPVEEGPVGRSGATGPIQSIYLRDPDGNLLEISNAFAD